MLARNSFKNNRGGRNHYAANWESPRHLVAARDFIEIIQGSDSAGHFWALQASGCPENSRLPIAASLA
jgi:hypothetical protein